MSQNIQNKGYTLLLHFWAKKSYFPIENSIVNHKLLENVTQLGFSEG